MTVFGTISEASFVIYKNALAANKLLEESEGDKLLFVVQIHNYMHSWGSI